MYKIFNHCKLLCIPFLGETRVNTLRAGLRYIIYSYFEISLKPAVVSCLTNALAPPPIALEKAVQGLKRIGQSSRLHSKENFLVGVCGFFVSDIISEVVFGLFWLMLPGYLRLADC